MTDAQMVDVLSTAEVSADEASNVSETNDHHLASDFLASVPMVLETVHTIVEAEHLEYFACCYECRRELPAVEPWLTTRSSLGVLWFCSSLCMRRFFNKCSTDRRSPAFNVHIATSFSAAIDSQAPDHSIAL
jgi:hypothetical protein